jgi:hypothetical protein
MGRMGDALVKSVTDYPLIGVSLLCFGAALVLGIANADWVAIAFIVAGLILAIVGIVRKQEGTK